MVNHSPTLKTILMVEKTLKNMPNSLMTVPELKKALPKKINHNTLKEILHYLDKSGKIIVSIKGIIWNGELNSKLDSSIKKGIPY